VHPDWPRPLSGTRMVQGYLVSKDGLTVRVRVAAETAWLTVKGPTVNVSRTEFEYSIPVPDADQMLLLCQGGRVEKTRYLIREATHVFEVDVFEGESSGLVVAELELASETEPFPRPVWLGEEVSLDRRYSNSSLARFPFRLWPNRAELRPTDD
jgi:adenylate cyclase